MKQVIYTLSGFLIFVMTVMVLLSIQGRSLRQTEVGEALAESMEGAMLALGKEQEQTPDKDSMITGFLQLFLAQLNSTSDVEVTVRQADAARGLLSVAVTEQYRHPNGKEGSVSEERIAVLNQEEESEQQTCTALFYTADNILYKQCVVTQGDICRVPKRPQKEGKTFRGWRYVTGGTGMLGQQSLLLREDTKFIAVFE